MRSAIILLFLLLSTLISCDQPADKTVITEYRLEKIFDLPIELPESSGLIIYDSLLWTFNDSRNGAILYALDMNNGEIRRIVRLVNAVNHDWEDIAQDSASIYIGDIGNGWGSRENLGIYILDKSQIEVRNEQNCTADSIIFSFEDQEDYTESYHATSFDCEALISMGDSLYVFTKDWLESHSACYSLPKIPGKYRAKHIDEFDSHGLVTGAVFDESAYQIALCGYDGIQPFVIRLNLDSGLHISNLTPLHLDFPESIGVQTEGIDIFHNHIYLTAENSSFPSAFYELK